MKLVLLLSLVCAVGVVSSYVTEVTETTQQQQQQLTTSVNQYVSECMQESGESDEGGPTENDLFKAMFSNEKDDKSAEKITHCFFHKAGILKPDGTLNVDAASSILALSGMKKEDADKIIEKCTSIAGDAKDMAYVIFKCFEGGFKG